MNEAAKKAIANNKFTLDFTVCSKELNEAELRRLQLFMQCFFDENGEFIDSVSYTQTRVEL